MSALKNYPFLAAAVEDIRLAMALIRGQLDVLSWEDTERQLGSPRHTICLLHDAIEFILYESLLAVGEDIYKNGQNTIGLDSAIGLCKSKGIDIPLISTVRLVQKHRGDAKHHAQIPHEDAFDRMTAEFRIFSSLMIHERFAESLGVELGTLPLVSYHVALFDAYRKYRTHKWSEALRFALAALLHKHRSVAGLTDDYRGGSIGDPRGIIALFQKDVETTEYPAGPPEALARLKKLPKHLLELVAKGDFAQAADLAGRGYSEVDAVMPSAFDIRTARQVTNLLVQPKELMFRDGMMLSKWHRGDTSGKEDVGERLSKLLQSRPDLVEQFGKPYYDDDDDRYWKWWEFAVFDGIRWRTFHLDDFFELSLETVILDEEGGKDREQVAKCILAEFERAASAESPATPVSA